MAILGGSCERKNLDFDDPELVGLCDSAASAEVCFADIPPGYDVQEHIDDCVKIRQPEAEALSQECGELHRELMACLVGRDRHDELYYWYFGRLKDGDYVCHEETAAFRGACPGIWFAPE